MPRPKEYLPEIAEIFSHLDEPVRSDQTPILLNDTTILVEAELNNRLYLAQLFLKSGELLTRKGIKFVRDFQQHPVAGTYMRSSLHELHRRGKRVGILYYPPPNTRRLKDLQQQFFSIDRPQFDRLADALTGLPKALWVDVGILSSANLLYSSDETIQPRLQLLAVVAGSYLNQDTYESIIRKRLPFIQNRYTKT